MVLLVLVLILVLVLVLVLRTIGTITLEYSTLIATVLLLIFSNLLGPLKSNATHMAAFNTHQCFQVYFDFAKHVFSTSKKDHAFFI